MAAATESALTLCRTPEASGATGRDQRYESRRRDRRHVTDETERLVPAYRRHQATVLAGAAHGRAASGVDRGHDVRADLAAQHQPDHRHRLRRSDPQALMPARGRDLQAVQHRVDLRTAAVHDHRRVTGTGQGDDSGGELGERGRVQGIASELENHDRAGHGATPSAVRPAVSGRPSIRLAH
jgi:hypothetical protein